MAIIYDSNNHIFVKVEQQKHSGSLAFQPESRAESFYVNDFVDISQPQSPFFEFDTPSYYTLGGTINYYGQDYWSVFTNIYRPFIKFIFTANTEHFGTGTTILHNVYRIPYKDYTEYASEIIRKNIEQNKDYTTETVEETVANATGGTATTTTTRKVSSSSTTEKVAPKNFPESVSNFDLATISQNEKIKELLTNPILTITATTTGISTYTYILFLDEYQKNIGNFQQQMFEDYAQYFVTTQFEFVRERAIGLNDFYQLDEKENLVPVEFQQYFSELTPTNEHIITGGTFSGVTVYGNFFTYFLIPNKPKLEMPIVSGQLTTFSPKFFWSNANDGDSFLLQVTYNSGDCQSFSGVVYSYPITKENSVLSTDDMLNLPNGDWAIAQKKTDIIREYSVPLSYGSTFWYRIGNVKELVNLFGVKQTVITFSNIESAITVSDSYKNQVYVQSDSPHTENNTALIYPEYLDDNVSVLQKYMLSGSVSGSVVTGATVTLFYPNNNSTKNDTDLYGNYSFPNLDVGTYRVSVSYRGYQTTSPIEVVVSGDTTIQTIPLSLSWGNYWDTVESIGDHLMGEM